MKQRWRQSGGNRILEEGNSLVNLIIVEGARDWIERDEGGGHFACRGLGNGGVASGRNHLQQVHVR